MPFPHFDPVFLRLGPLEFRWYGLMYIFSFLASYFVIRFSPNRNARTLTNDDIADLIFTVALGIIIGGRSGYVVFYNLVYYLTNPLKIFSVWEGGMSFHGGLIGAIVAGFIFSKKKHMRFMQLADICFLAAPVGLCLGRIGNFINGELFGRVTSVPWGIIFPNGGIMPRHPSQLYEAMLEGPVMFGFLWYASRKNLHDGAVFWLFIILYGLFRFTVEFFREADGQMGYFFYGMTMGQLLSIPMIVFGMAMACGCTSKKRNI